MVESTPILEPFFNVVTFPFDEYRKLGALKLIVDPLWCGLTALTMVCVWILVPQHWPLLPLILVVGLILARMAATARLNRVIQKFVMMYHQRAGRTGGRPNVIAHSLGSYVVGTVLQRQPAVHYARVILYGCVLRRAFNWHGSSSSAEPRFAVKRVQGVWNEVGVKDRVPTLAEYLGPRFGLGFGGAGRYGFTGPAVHSRVHDQPCPCCSTGVRVAVHNVSSGLGHSDAFHGAGHCRKIWRPYLLGYDPAEYLYLMDLCDSVHSASTLDWIGADLFDAELAETEWDWCGGQLSARTIKIIQTMSPDLTEAQLWNLSDRVRAEFWSTIALAQRTEDGSQSSSLDSDDLDPKIVLQNCIRRVLADHG